MAHFEIYVNDMGAAKAFYGGLFGWEFTPMSGPDDPEYALAVAPDLGESKGLTVGMLARPDLPHAAGTAIRGGTMTFEVADCDARYAWAMNNGGAEALPPTDYPGIGRAACVEDGQGNVVGFISSTGGDT
ncbi:VOC family protein [Celeribacter sp.]|uniref:VOC family protein n=1 Tax=Celeribacter sp. TaxID=1890673 RepID=UPI003A8DDC7F